MKKIIITAIAAIGITGLLFSTSYAFQGKNRGTCPYNNNRQMSQTNNQGMNKNMNRQMNQQRMKNNYQNSGSQNKMGKGYGPGDGTGNQGTRPLDGTGYGAKNNQQ